MTDSLVLRIVYQWRFSGNQKLELQNSGKTIVDIVHVKSMLFRVVLFESIITGIRDRTVLRV
jgi:hypothetical protein